MKLFFSFFLCLVLLQANISSVNIVPSLKEDHFMGIKILDQKQLSFDQIKGVKFAELSDIAYRTKTKTLYMVGDKGALFAFRAVFGRKIDTLVPLRATKLKNKKGKRFKKWKRDSEGLTLDGRGRLFISFEGKA
ncbi:esterase-like activity of phytase family protein, partial [Sulfurovum sp.]|uniref:esterase-like activity of phytase family protein n=1 Tax=Sulfurovum sp. TaxID=1969726 RepID=UPI0025EED95A